MLLNGELNGWCILKPREAYSLPKSKPVGGRLTCVALCKLVLGILPDSERALCLLQMNHSCLTTPHTASVMRISVICDSAEWSNYSQIIVLNASAFVQIVYNNNLYF